MPVLPPCMVLRGPNEMEEALEEGGLESSERIPVSKVSPVMGKDVEDEEEEGFELKSKTNQMR